MHLSLVSPVYNEDSGIEEFVRRSSKSLAQLTDTFEMVLVNDCSTDRTRFILEKLKKEIPEIKLINLLKNSGQHAATLIGLKHTCGEFVFLMDSDLQDPPEEIATLYNFGTGCADWDIISGCRNTRSNSIVRSIGSKFVSALINFLTKSKMKDPGSTFLLMKKAAVEKICENEIFAQNLQILMGFLGFKILDTEIKYNTKNTRKSNYKLRDLVELLILAILNFTTGRMTMIVLLLLGSVMILFGSSSILFLILYGVIARSPLPTNLLIFFSFNLIIGVQFLFLGIIAYKLERINKNLTFRKNLYCMIDE